jgi:hypothetical protein
MNYNIQNLKVLSVLLVVVSHSRILPYNIWVSVTLGMVAFSSH